MYLNFYLLLQSLFCVFAYHVNRVFFALLLLIKKKWYEKFSLNCKLYDKVRKKISYELNLVALYFIIIECIRKYWSLA